MQHDWAKQRMIKHVLCIIKHCFATPCHLALQPAKGLPKAL